MELWEKHRVLILRRFMMVEVIKGVEFLDHHDHSDHTLPGWA
jgi:hypothetical protein